MKHRNSLIASRHGVAAIEFALCLPILVTALAGLTDLSLAIRTERRLTFAAQSVAMIASTMAVQTTALNLLSGQQAWQATTAPFVLFPSWTNATLTAGNFSITLSAVSFVASSSGYIANTQWSVANPSGQTLLRPCGILTPVPDSSAFSSATLPASSFGPTPILVADVSTVFMPVFSTVFLGSVTMTRSAFISPRTGQAVQLTGVAPAVTVICVGTSP